MGLFDFIYKKDKQYLPEDKFDGMISSQEELAPVVLDHLKEFGLEDNQELMLEFFFYTNSLEKGLNLSEEIKKLGYTIYSCAECGFKQGTFSIDGCTTPMNMSDDNVANWAKKMCELGYIFDCEFDGWGTMLNQ